MTDVEYLESRMREDREECARLRMKEHNDKISAELHAIYQSLVDKGFSEEQAFILFMEMVRRAFENA